MELGEVLIESVAEDDTAQENNDVIIYAIVAMIVVILLSLVTVIVTAILVYHWRVKKMKLEVMKKEEIEMEGMESFSQSAVIIFSVHSNHFLSPQ